jgi:dihydroflavonol-4-reductase
MRLAVTGAAGLIGGHVVRAAVAGGHKTTAVLRATSRTDALAGVDVAIAIADVLGETSDLVEVFGGNDTVIHTAAIFAYGGDPDTLRRVATEGTARVLHAAAEAGVRRVVVTSSSVVFGYSLDGAVIDETRSISDGVGQPPYVAAKIAQDRAALSLAERLGLELVLACPTMSIGGIATTLGPSNGLIVAYLADPGRSTFPGGCNIVSAEDIGSAHVLLAVRGSPGQHYLLGSENLQWSEIHALIGVLTGVGGPYVEIGPSVAGILAGAESFQAYLMGRTALTSREQAGMLGRFYWYDHGRAAAIGYRPRPAAVALIEAVSWLAASPHVSREMRVQMHLNDAVQRFRYAEPSA